MPLYAHGAWRFGYKEKKDGNNAQKKNPYTVYGIQLTRNALKDDNKKMRDRKAETEKQRQKSKDRKAEVENYVCCKD